MTERIPVPPAVSPAPPAGFPLVAVLAPLVMAGVLWLVTGAAYALLFGLLGPVVALASLADARRQRRRARRRERARYTALLEQLDHQVDQALARARAGLAEPADPRTEWGALAVTAEWGRTGQGGRTGERGVLVGRGALPSGIEVAESPEGLDQEHAERLSNLRRRAMRLDDAPLRLAPTGGIGVIGAELVARSVARGIVLRLAAEHRPDSLEIAVPPGEEWAAALPHRVRSAVGAAWRLDCAPSSGEGRTVIVAWGEGPAEFGEGVGRIIDLRAPAPPSLYRGLDGSGEPIAPVAVTRPEARAWAGALADAAERSGLARAGDVPARVAWADLAQPSSRPGALTAAVGRDADGPVVLDLVRDGPHALVAGTTGSGKSELLTSWILGLAAGATPRELVLLLVDFKGGASFAPLARLPHVAGIVSDLDPGRSRRVVLSLRAELLRRERLLASSGARSIDELADGQLARLVVVVDEYAVLLRENPDLHELFADLAARGRSLGIHLILCTQRPSGVVRDAILANVTVRIALRLRDRADSTAMVGDDSAAALEAIPGRAVLADGAASRLVQLAHAAPADIAAVIERAAPGAAAPAFWLEELPVRLPRAALPADPDAWPLGLVDRPELQSRLVATYRPRSDGPLLVLGAPRSGRSGVVALLGAEGGALVLPRDPADAWAALDALEALPPERWPELVAIDDLDLLIAACGDRAPTLVDRLDGLFRRLPAQGIGLVATAAGTAALRGLHRGASTRLLLRQASRDDQVLVGLDGRDHDPAAPPGRGWWGGHLIQVAHPEGDAASIIARATHAPAIPVIALTAGLGFVTPRVRAVLHALRQQGIGAENLVPGETLAAPGAVLVGDPDAWQASWDRLAAARQGGALLLDRRCSPAELRLLARTREDPPLLADRDDEWWLVGDGELRRVRVGAGSA